MAWLTLDHGGQRLARGTLRHGDRDGAANERGGDDHSQACPASGSAAVGPFGKIQSFAERAVVPAAAGTSTPGLARPGQIRSPRLVTASRPLSATAAIGPAVLSAPGDGGVCGCGRVGAVFLPSAIRVPSSAARAVFRAVRSPTQIWPIWPAQNSPVMQRKS